MKRMRLITCLCAAVVTLFLSSQGSSAKPLRISYAIWVGNGPFFVAEQKGFFANEGVEVEMINAEIGGAQQLFDRQVDAMPASIDTGVVYVESDERLVCALALDESLGGDGIVANDDIGTIADLEGKVVAFQSRTTPQFYLNVLLEEAGLSEADIEVVDLGGQDAGEAFLLQEVDAAVTWEPWLSQGKNVDHGHLLSDSSQHPGLIVDCLFTTPDVFNERKAEFQALARAWDAAVAYIDAHPEEANAIMAREVGGWLEDPAVFADTLDGIRFYDAERNREYFGTPENPGQVYDTVQKVIDVYSHVGLLEADVTPADFVAHGVWE
ncbi:MAG: ABC transporter substrate-binding protein [Acidiferrobacterales bacterium]